MRQILHPKSSWVKKVCKWRQTAPPHTVYVSSFLRIEFLLSHGCIDVRVHARRTHSERASEGNTHFIESKRVTVRVRMPLCSQHRIPQKWNEIVHFASVIWTQRRYQIHIHISLNVVWKFIFFLLLCCTSTLNVSVKIKCENISKELKKVAIWKTKKINKEILFFGILWNKKMSV